MTGSLMRLAGVDLDLALAQGLGDPLHVVDVGRGRFAVLAAAPVGALDDRGPVGVAALGADDALGLQALDGVVDVLDLHLAGFPVAGEHAQRGLFPAVAGHGPVLARQVEEDGGLGHVLGVVLGLAGVAGVHDVRADLVHGDLEARIVVLVLLGHPLAGLHPVFAGDVHLRAVDAVHARADLELPGHEALRIEQAARVGDHLAHIDAVGAVLGAARAAGALGPADLHGVAHELVVHLAVPAGPSRPGCSAPCRTGPAWGRGRCSGTGSSCRRTARSGRRCPARCACAICRWP